jgi:hypothetical protein
MKLYTIEKVGVYRHGILGVFTDEAKARACAETVTKTNAPNHPYDDPNDGDPSDGDGYHSYELLGHYADHGAPGVLIATWKSPGGKYGAREKNTAPYAWVEADVTIGAKA